jgi:hypothetical protein
MKTIGIIKRGDTFSFTVSLTDSSTNEALTGISANLKCQGKYKVDDIIPLVIMTVSETSIGGTYLFTAPSTNAWKSSNVYFDIQYTNDSGIVSSTETFYVQVIGDITR